jgi:PAS domain-containing protein
MCGGDSIPQLVSAVYDAALDADLWPSVLAQFAQAFGSRSAHLSEDNLASNAGKLLSYGFDTVFDSLYAQHYAARNVLWKNIVRRCLQGVLTDRIIMSREDLTRSEFYNDFLQPQGVEEVLCFVGTPHHDVCMNLVLGREHRHGVWGAKDMKALAMVTPHFDRALGINRQIGDLRIVGDTADEALYQLNCGVILVDPGASVLFANRVAERLFGGGLRIERKRLAAQRSGETRGAAPHDRRDRANRRRSVAGRRARQSRTAFGVGSADEGPHHTVVPLRQRGHSVHP